MLCTEKVFPLFVTLKMYNELKCKHRSRAWGLAQRTAVMPPELSSAGRGCLENGCSHRVCSVLLTTWPRATQSPARAPYSVPTAGTHGRKRGSRSQATDGFQTWALVLYPCVFINSEEHLG